MPIDPHIPLGVQAPRIQNPLVSLSRLAQLQQTIGTLRQQQQHADQAAMQQVLTETGGNLEEALPRLRQIAPATALDLQQKLFEHQRTQAETRRAQIEQRVNEDLVAARSVHVVGLGPRRLDPERAGL
jgi:hypothetical protein